jgi:hypothetical protein
MIIQYNSNPNGKFIGDCVIRAITAVTGMTWQEVYVGLCLQGYKMADLPSSNAVWAAYLRNQGFIRKTLPDCCTIEDFAREHRKGAYIVATGTHAAAVIGGNIYDSWDSSQEIVVYYFERKI